MVVKSVLPNLLNVAQIVNIFNNASNNQPFPLSDPAPSSLDSSQYTRGAVMEANSPLFTYISSQNGRFDTDRYDLGHQPPRPSATLWTEECSLEVVAIHNQRIINLIFNENYDKHLTPDPKGVTVSIELALQTFYDISENSASFTADVLMSQIWHDRRLSYSNYTNCVENLTLSSAITDKIWQPFVCFVNSKKSELHTSPSPNTFVLIYPNGTVWVNYRLRIEGPCYVNLELYPFNEEECELILESYAYNAANVRLKWRDWNPVIQYPSRTKLPDFVLSEIKWAKHQFIYAAGQWDQLSVSFFLTRQFGVYIVQMYFPVETAVAMSWIPFFLDHRSLPARITLGVSALMSITFQYGNILKNLPRVSYIMSVDVWIFVAVIFVACSLVELAIVGHLHRKARSRHEGRGRGISVGGGGGSGVGRNDSVGSRKFTTDRPERRATRRRKEMKNRKASQMTLRASISQDSNSSFRDDTTSYYGTFFQDCEADVPPLNAASILHIGGGGGGGGGGDDDALGKHNCAPNHSNGPTPSSPFRPSVGGDNRPLVTFGALSRFSSRSFCGEGRRNAHDWTRADSRRKKTSVNFNYTVFQARFVYKKIRDKWKDPLYWDETSRFYFPLSFFIFNIIYWFYYLGYHKLLKPILNPFETQQDASELPPDA